MGSPGPAVSANQANFSPAAQQELESLSSDFIQDLLDISVRFARRGGLDMVSKAQVRRAHDLLERGGRRERTAQALTTIGGALVGGGMSLWITLLLGSQILSLASAGVASVLLVIGVFLVAIAFRV